MRRPRKSLRSTRLTRLRVMDAPSSNDAIDSSDIFYHRRSLNIVRVPTHPVPPDKPRSRSAAMAHDMTLRKPLPLGALSIAFANPSRSRYTIRHRHLNGEHKRRTCSNPKSETAWSEAIYAAVPHDQLPPVKINIFDSQSHTFHQPHARPIQQAGHQLVRARHPGEQPMRFGTRQHHRQPRRAPGPLDLANLPQFHVQHFAIQKHQPVEGLILRGHRHLLVHRQIVEKRLHFSGSQLARMTPAPGGHRTSPPMKLQKPSDPLPISFLGADGVMFESRHLTELIQQFELGIGNEAFQWP